MLVNMKVKLHLVFIISITVALSPVSVKQTECTLLELCLLFGGVEITPFEI